MIYVMLCNDSLLSEWLGAPSWKTPTMTSENPHNAGGRRGTVSGGVQPSRPRRESHPNSGEKEAVVCPTIGTGLPQKAEERVFVNEQAQLVPVALSQPRQTSSVARAKPTLNIRPGSLDQVRVQPVLVCCREANSLMGRGEGAAAECDADAGLRVVVSAHRWRVV